MPAEEAGEPVSEPAVSVYSPASFPPPVTVKETDSPVAELTICQESDPLAERVRPAPDTREGSAP